MVKIIVMAHGHFSSGILSSLELIAGQQENVVGIDFLAGMSSHEVKTALVNELETTQEALILTDLLGGTPFNVASTYSMEQTDKTLKVLAGLNLAMLMEAVFSRALGMNLGMLSEKVIASSHNGIIDFASCLSVQNQELEFEGGI
ncbi:PTS sugar transporter subunit IIA [Streptococcus halichoeri]|uniref:PTS sugar transporter subunit IIA n=1 Tax=Streptococcus halichoeri TaxID=254785 RepID=UPI00135A394A|nr:PTS sugar transporter subunit IIA [Streptococcus halichoeri]